MANTRLFHRSFVGGELAPEMFGRIDADRYQTGAARVRNMVCKPHGPVQRRPGFEYVREVKDSTKKIRLIPFRFSAGQTYAIELGAGYIRIHQNGETLNNVGQSYPAYKSSKDLQSVNTTTNVITLAAAHAFATGDPIRFTVQTSGFNVLPSPLRVGVTYYVRVVSSTQISVATTAAKAQTVNAADLIRLYNSGTNLSGCRAHYRYTAGDVVTHTPPAGTLGTYSCCYSLPSLHPEYAPQQGLGGTPWYRMPADNTYEIAFAATEAMLSDIHYVQSNDVLTITHPSLPPCELRRYDDRKWVVETINFKPSCATPVDSAVTPRYGERFVVNNWQSQNGDIFASPVGFTRCVFTQKRPLSAGDVLYVTDTKWGLLDNKRWIIYPDTSTGGSSINSNNFLYLQDYESGEVFQPNTEFAVGNVTNSGGHALFTVAYDHGFESGANVGFYIETGSSTANVSEWPAQSYYVVPVSSTTFKLSSTDPLTVTTYVNYTASNTSKLRLVVIGGVVQSVSQIASLDNSYKITAVHADLSESDATAELLVRNNIYSYGAFNSLTWRYYVGSDPTGLGLEYEKPSRFNVYKKDVGAYGLMGSVPVYDTETTTVTLSYDTYIRVNWPNHPFLDNDAISFTEIAGGGLLAGLVNDRVYYVKRITSGAYSGQLKLQVTPDGEEVRYSSIIANVTCLARREYCFRDDNIAPDLGNSIPNRDTVFVGNNQYPAAVSYFEQRRVFAGSNASPQNVWMTKSATESDLSYRIPTVSDDRIAFRMAAREAFQIRHVVPMSSLLLLTESGEWRVTSVDSDALTPTSISVRPQSYVGSNNVQPVAVNNIVLFASHRGGHLREMGFNNDQQSYITGDLSLRASHLFDDYELVDLGVAKAPSPIVWCVSSNGTLLGLTYIPEERVVGWHWHDTDGVFETLCVVQEGEEDRVYACIKRTIGGVDKRYIERMAPFKVQALEDTRYVDSWVEYDSTPTTVISGLTHLDGKTVSILADGQIHTQKVVTAGAVTLDYEASNVVVGLPYTSELHTLPATIQIDGFGMGRTKNVGRSWVRVFESPGFEIGTAEGGMTSSTSYTEYQNINNGVMEVTLPPTWTQEGQVILQQANPVPLTVVGMTFEVSVGS